MLGDGAGKCCWNCGSRDHNYEACETSAATVEDRRPDAGLNHLLPVEAVCRPEPLTGQLFWDGVPGRPSRNFQCLTCGTLRLAIPEVCDDFTFVDCLTCGRSMGSWSQIKQRLLGDSWPRCFLA